MDATPRHIPANPPRIQNQHREDRLYPVPLAGNAPKSGPVNSSTVRLSLVPPATSPDPLGDEMLDKYENYLRSKRRSPNTVRVRVLHVRALQKVHPDLTVVTGLHLEMYIEERSPNWAAETINAVTSSFKMFFKWACPRYGMAHNPTIELEGVPVVRKPPRVASDTAIRASMLAAPPRVQLILLLGAECGLRRQEIASLHTSSRDGDWLTVKGKGSKYRSLKLSENLQHHLDNASTDGYYFPNKKGGHITGDWVYKLCLRYLGKNPHALRHRAGGTVYKGTGNDIRLTQEFLGHSNPKTTARYVEVGREDLKRAGAAAELDAA